MKHVNYKNIGNVREDYNHEPRTVSPVGLITSPNLVLKMYNMIKEAPFSWDTIVDAKKFLTEEIKNEKIEPLTGLGFVILSENMLNVAKWDDMVPIVLKNQIYSYVNYTDENMKILGYGNKFDGAELLDIKDVGAFCIWELGIVNHEKGAWKMFLKSERTEAYKKAYLGSVIEGRL